MNADRTLPGRLLVAIGGNAFHPGDISGTVEQQVDIAAHTGASMLPLMELDSELIVTHGNGPVVGKILMRQVLAREHVTPMSLDICVAHSQGGIAYLLMQALENALREIGNPRHVVCLLSQVEVDPDDPAFQNPTKPIGHFYDEDQARDLEKLLGWTMREDAGPWLAARGALAPAPARRRHFTHRHGGQERRRVYRRRRRWYPGRARRQGRSPRT